MYQELIQDILQTVLIPLIVALTSFAIKWLNAKATSLKENTKDIRVQKYIELLNKTVQECVAATMQTYVDALKKENAFTKDAQIEAFNMSYNAVMSILSEDATIYLTEFYGDLNSYVTQLIEAEVKKTKIEK